MSITGNGDEDKEEDKSEGAKVHPLTMYSGGGSSPVMDISCTLLDRNDIFAKRRDIKLLSVTQIYLRNYWQFLETHPPIILVSIFLIFITNFY